MADMILVQQFNDELQSLHEIKPPVSKAKMVLITKAAMKGIKFYKHIVQGVERFIAKCNPEYKIPGLYVIDSIVRQSIHQYGNRDVYAGRFARNLEHTFNELFFNCAPEDKPKIIRVLNLWQKNGVFSSKTIQPILKLANTGASRCEPISADSPSSSYEEHGSTAELLLQQLSNTMALVKNSSSNQHQTQKQADNNSGSSSGIRFNKSILGFDYEDDDDGDETPTEAEPPLSTTLNRFGMEQRKSSLMNYDHRVSQEGYTSRQPVLERWQKLMGQNLAFGDVQTSSSNLRRTRSRSPNSPEHGNAINSSRDDMRMNHDSYRSPSTPPDDVKEMNPEKLAERKKKGFPEIRNGFLTICSTTLWLGHVPKTVSEADISDAFGEFGAITSIDLIPPRGCAYVCMDRRQDAMKALQGSKSLKLNGSHIKMAWAPGKGLKDKKFKDFWEVELGASYIPISKIDVSIDLDTLEEGGVLDEDTLTPRIRQLREEKTNENSPTVMSSNQIGHQPAPAEIPPLLAQPAPFPLPPNLSIPPPSAIPQMPMPYAQLPITMPLNQKLPDSPNVDHLNNITRMATPMISVPNAALFQAPPPPFKMPPMHPNQGGPSQPLFLNPPPMFNQPPPNLPMDSLHHMMKNKSPDFDRDVNQRLNERPNELNDNRIHPTHSLQLMRPRDLASTQKNDVDEDKMNNFDAQELPFGRLLPRPGQVDLYPTDDEPQSNMDQFNERQLRQQQQQQPARLFPNPMERPELPAGLLPNQGPFAVNPMNQFNFSNGMLDSMLNQAFMEPQMQFNTFENQFDPNIQPNGLQLDDQQQQFQNRGRNFHRSRRKRRNYNR